MDMQAPEFNTLDPVFADHVLNTLASTVPAGEGLESSPAPARDAEAGRREAARILFDAMRPQDAADAALAALAVAAFHAAMDNFARAALPGTPDEKAMRLRSNALAASRSYSAVLRTLRKQQSLEAGAERQAPGSRARGQGRPVQPARNRAASEATGPALLNQPMPGNQPGNQTMEQTRDAPQQAAIVEPANGPSTPQFQPRDESGKPIPLWRWEWMTMAQRRAAYCDPKNAAYAATIAEAIAEEAAMIAGRAEADRLRAQDLGSDVPGGSVVPAQSLGSEPAQGQAPGAQYQPHAAQPFGGDPRAGLALSDQQHADRAAGHEQGAQPTQHAQP
jgi:hypothetical protein